MSSVSDDARALRIRSREAQGLTPRITSASALDALAEILRCGGPPTK